MSIDPHLDQHIVHPSEISDRYLRDSVRAVEAKLVRQIGAHIRPSFRQTYDEPLHLELPDGSFHTWVLGFEAHDGNFCFVVYEENSLVRVRDVVTVAPTVPLAEAGLCALLFFETHLEGFVKEVVHQVRRQRGNKH